MNNYVIETRNLTKQYETQKSVADLNIHVKKGRIYGLLGRNGAGKTTTMKMLLGPDRTNFRNCAYFWQEYPDG